MPKYEIPKITKPPKVGKKQILLVASGDLRTSANQTCWPAQKEMEDALGRAIEAAGYELVRAHPYKEDEKHGFIGSQKEGLEVFAGIDPNAKIIVAEAVWQERRLKMRYRSWNRVSDRLVDPLGVVLKAGTWYMVARSEGDVRTFRLSSVQSLEMLDTRFSRPRKFDLPKYWSASTKRFETSVYRTKARMRVSPLGLRRLQSFGATVAESATRTATAPDAGGWMQVTIPIESAEDAAREMLRLGTEAEVLEPAELRERLKSAVDRLAALYADASSAASRLPELAKSSSDVDPNQARQSQRHQGARTSNLHDTIRRGVSNVRRKGQA
jgi:hypothetical protein